MGSIEKIVLLLLALPKSLYFNLRYFGWRAALRLPVLVSHRCRLRTVRGGVRVPEGAPFGSVRIGFGDVSIFDGRSSRTIWDVSGTVVFLGRAGIGHGSKLSVHGGEVVFGDNFTITAETQIVSKKRISFGRDCLISWQCLILDTDFHSIRDSAGALLNPDKEITIGDRVWIGCRTSILKGTEIGDDVVVASNSCLSGKVPGKNQVVGGSPPRALKTGITWEQ